MRYSFKSLLHHPSVLLGCLLLAALGACDEPPQTETEVSVLEALAFDLIGRGQQARLDTTEMAIRNAETWAAYQDSLRPLQPFKEVDFSQEMVLLAAVPVPSGGYSVFFETIEKTQDSLTAHYRLSIPAFDCMTTMGEAVVFQAVRVARSDTPLRFEHEREAYQCTKR